jgi:hypothetical protein
MTIDDELLLELFKPDRYGKVGKGALIVKIVGRADIGYNLEQSYWFYLDADAVIKKEKTQICPDIVVSGEMGTIAIELENDIQWDFAESLRQMKNYKHQFADIRVIIPYEYERFAPLYKNEGGRVWLWQAKRKWRCLRCGTINVNESRVPPQCKNGKCKNKSRDEFDLVGLENADFNEYE